MTVQHLTSLKENQKKVLFFGKLLKDEHSCFINLIKNLNKRLSLEERKKIKLIATSSTEILDLDHCAVINIPEL